jgi:serralysin
MAQPRVTSNAPSQKTIDSVQFAMPAGMDVWHTSSEAPLRLTYRFNSAQPGDLSYKFSGWTAFSATQEKAVGSVLAEYASIINVVFEETSSADPDLNFGRVSLGSAGLGGYGYSYRTDGAGNVTSAALDGFAVFDNTIDIAARRPLILHEIGHAMTLKHTGNYDAHGDGAPGPYLPASQDNTKYSVMSYNPNPDNARESDHLMLYDIAALQARFGANLDYRTGNDVYRGPQGLIQAVWDAGGTDRIDGSGYSKALTIDLRDGHFSSLGAKSNFAVAYGVIIENATGGSGDDRITGNQWDNVICGGKGADRISGGAGNDRLIGGPGDDVLSGGSGRDCFVFKTALDSDANVDRITDFSPVNDVFRLDDAIFESLAKDALAAATFRIGAAALDANDRIIYNDDTGALVYDANGNAAGKATCFARLDAHLAITSADFLII